MWPRSSGACGSSPTSRSTQPALADLRHAEQPRSRRELAARDERITAEGQRVSTGTRPRVVADDAAASAPVDAAGARRCRARRDRTFDVVLEVDRPRHRPSPRRRLPAGRARGRLCVQHGAGEVEHRADQVSPHRAARDIPPPACTSSGERHRAPPPAVLALLAEQLAQARHIRGRPNSLASSPKAGDFSSVSTAGMQRSARLLDVGMGDSDGGRERSRTPPGSCDPPGLKSGHSTGSVSLPAGTHPRGSRFGSQRACCKNTVWFFGLTARRQLPKLGFPGPWRPAMRKTPT